MANYNCDDLAALLPLDSCYNFQQQSELWNVIKDIVCATCTITVPAGTSAVDFACFWESSDAGGWPDSSNCPVLTVIEGCNIWMAPNDPLNCDLGECPAVDGTGTDWVLIGQQAVGNVHSVFYAVNMIEEAGYHAYGVSGIAMQYQDILIQDSAIGTYDNSAGVSRWTCHKDGFYRFSYTCSIQVDTVGWYNGGASAQATHQGVLKASFASNAIIKSGVMALQTTAVAPGITSNFYMPFQYWGFAPGLPAGITIANITNPFDPFQIGHIYLQDGDYVDFVGNSSLATSVGTIQWRFSQNAYPSYSAYMLIEEVQL